ncbi:hypothetical protein [Streptomyces sp. NPDC101150]|uniref:hypothetical protein n=1 Tax=Streptomyces sp. NPDC101150 TaxID=3366114 RepID=UPI0037FE0C72
MPEAILGSQRVHLSPGMAEAVGYNGNAGMGTPGPGGQKMMEAYKLFNNIAQVLGTEKIVLPNLFGGTFTPM